MSEVDLDRIRLEEVTAGLVRQIEYQVRPTGFFIKHFPREMAEGLMSFAEDYREETGMMDFSLALQLLRTGVALQRTGWNGAQMGQSMYVKLLRPGDGAKMTQPYLFMTVVGGAGVDGPVTTRIPWQPSHVDLLATDWRTAEER